MHRLSFFLLHIKIASIEGFCFKQKELISKLSQFTLIFTTDNQINQDSHQYTI